MIKRNNFGSKIRKLSYKEILAAEAHLAERKFFIARADIEQRKVSDISSRNSKINSFQNRRAELRTAVNLNKEECV
jgi:hypothetical protein